MTIQIEPHGSLLLAETAPMPGNRAFALDRRYQTALVGLSLLGLSILAGCGESKSAESDSAQASSSAKAMVEHLIELSTPLDPTLTSDHHDRQLHAWRAYLAELRGASREVGLNALERFREVKEQAEVAPILVRKNLLDIASHAATEETAPLLESLLMEYGHRIDIRTEATLLLGEVAPERAVELLTPILKRTKSTSTMPADEFLLKAFVLGCEGSGHDPVPILADVATNIHKAGAARHQAVQELGKHRARIAQQALRSILIESTGNAYLRRKAAQALRDSLPREEACAIFNEVATFEADTSFLIFLGDMIQENCE